MSKLLQVLAIITGTFILAAQMPARAQLLHSWIASNGNDANNCDRPTPCATLNGAYAKTQPGGEITCVDGGDYSFLTIRKPLTINCEAAIGSTAVPGGANFGDINVTGLGATDVVTLRGLDFDGANVVAGETLIALDGAGTLRLEKLKASGIHGHSIGVLFAPTGTARLHVIDSVIANNATSGLAAGIHVAPTAQGQATIVIERALVDNNQFGIFLDGTQGGTIRGAVRDSVVSGNTNNGISVNTSGANVSLLVDNTLVSGNNIGLVVAGTNGLILVRRSTITANNTGLSAGSGGQVVSYRDNSLNNNTVDGAFSFAIATQ